MKPGRNDPCSCGSGRKYKHCCGATRPTAARNPAAAVLRQAVRPAPENATTHNDIGLIHLRSHRLAEAARYFQQAIAGEPNLAVAHYNLGCALELQGDDNAAIGAYRRAVSLAPKLADAHERLGNLLLAHRIFGQALDCFRRVAQIVPNSLLGQLNRAKVLHQEGNLAEAEACLRRAIALDPASSEAHRFLGNILRETGSFDEAVACFDRLIVLNPGGVAVYHDLVQSKRLTEFDRPLIARMLSLLNADGVVYRDRVALHFALGKGLDDLGDYQQAIRHFDEANRLAGRGVRFDRTRFAIGTSRLIASFTPEFFRAHRALGRDSQTPVLILGMMRSGTTLVEQILSSNPEVAAGDELMFWHERAEAYAHAGAEGLTAAYLHKLADDYQAQLGGIGREAARVTDKMPDNFLWIGLIHLVFPKATAGVIRSTPVFRSI